jgi:Xaa-Pro aminopeptidase
VSASIDPSGRLVGPDRIRRIRGVAEKVGAGCVLITSSEDLRWACGFTGSNGWLLVEPERISFLTDSRYFEQVRIESEQMGLDPDVVLLAPGENFAGLIGRVLAGSVDRRPVLFQSRSLNVAQFLELQKAVDAELVPIASEFDHLRRHKDAFEIDAISKAAAIADQALAEVTPLLTASPSERDIRDELEYRMRRLGADGPSYDTIVATGPVNSAKPHHRPSSTVVEEGHSVVIDVGALVGGYHSDMTRTFLIGDVDSELRRMYDVVRIAQAAAVEAVKPGVACQDIDAVCRGILEEHGLVDLVIHGTGHGVGLAIHEDPYIGRLSAATLEVGDVVTVEPGLYRMGLGGVRIEDLLVVTQSAHHNLSSLPKDSPCLPSLPMT